MSGRLFTWIALFCGALLARGDVYFWNAAGPNAVWSAGANWIPNGVPGAADSAIFNNTNAMSSAGLSAVGGGPDSIISGNFDSLVDTGFSGMVADLICSNTGGFYQNIYLTNGVTLSVTNEIVIGTTNQDPGSGATGTITIAGPQGSLVATNNTNATEMFGFVTAGGTGAVETTDMSALGSFTAVCRQFLVGTTFGKVSGTVRPGGILYLAQTNSITAGYQTTSEETSATAGALVVGETSGNNGGDCYLYLGQQNTISADSVLCGREKVSHGQIEFNPALTGNPTVTFSGFTQPRVLIWSLGDGINNSGTTSCTGTEDFSLGTINAAISNMYVGRGTSAGTGTAASTGTFTFAAGTVNVNTLGIGLQSEAVATKYGVGTVNVNSNSLAGAAATLIVNSNILLGQSIDSTSTSGSLDINGGNVWANNIIGSSNGGLSSITISQGVLVVTNSVGSSAMPLGTLELTSATLDLAATNSAPVTVGSLVLDDSSSVINISSLPPIFGYPTTFPLIAYTTAGGTMNLGTLPATYAGYLHDDNAGTISIVITNGPAAVKTDTWTGSVNDVWDTTTLNWTANGSPAAYAEKDLVVFDDSASAGNVAVPAPHAPDGWIVTNNTLNYIFSGPGSIVGGTGLDKQGGGSVTLADTGGDNFTGGIVVEAGKVTLDDANSAIAGSVSIGAGATLQIGNGDTNGNLPSGALTDDGALVFDSATNFTVAAAITGTGSLTQSGSGRLTLSAVNTYTGNTAVSGGTLALTQANAITNSATVSITAAALDLSTLSGTAHFNNLSLSGATLDVSLPYLQPAVSANSMSLGGASNVINIITMPPLGSYPSTVTVLQTVSGFGGFNFVLGALPAGYAATVGQSPDGTAVQLNVTSGPAGGATRPFVQWSGKDAATSTNWTDNGNWQSPGAPVAGDIVVFSDVDAAGSSALSSTGGGVSALQPSAVNNSVNADFDLSSLAYTNVADDWQNTYVAAGQTLSITNNGGLSIGSSSVDYGGSAVVNVSISGPAGTLSVNNTNATFFVGAISTGSAPTGTLDMSALGAFDATVGTFYAGAVASTADVVSGAVYLAETNMITAVGGAPNEGGQDEPLSLAVGESGKGGAGTSYLYLGLTNTLYLNSMGVGIAKQPGQMQFNSIYTSQNPGVLIRAADGVSPVSLWAIGDGLAQTGASTTPSGTVDFTGGTVDALVDTMYLGRSPNVSGGHAATGNLTFGAGTINVATMNVGYQAHAGSDWGSGTVTLNGPGSLIVGNLNLAFSTDDTGGPSTTGTLQINGGTASLGTVVAGTNGAVSAINLAAGTLAITGGAGTAAAPLTALAATGGTIELTVNGAAPATNIVATTITATATTLGIPTLVNVATNVPYPLISYTGADPFGGLTLAPLPTGYAGALVDDTAHGLISLNLTAVSAVTPPPPSAPEITSVQLVSGTNFVLSATNATGSGTFYVLTTTNLALPLSEWTRVATNSYRNGVLNFTNAVNPATPGQFYTLQVP